MAFEDAKSSVQTTLANHKVVIFLKTTCPFCAKAKDILEHQLNPKDLSVVELDKIPNGGMVQATLTEMTGISTVPQVFIGGQCIGGCDDTEAKASNGELSQLLRAQGLGAVAA